MVANNPASRLHSQLDTGAVSARSKVAGREPIRIHPLDAAARGVSTGDVVVVENDRGRILAGAVVSDAVSAGVVQLSTGAWYDPDDPAAESPTCVHGNPNVLTADVGTSRLAQACTGQHCLVEVSAFDGAPPPVRAHQPPPTTTLAEGPAVPPSPRVAAGPTDRRCPWIDPGRVGVEGAGGLPGGGRDLW